MNEILKEMTQLMKREKFLCGTSFLLVCSLLASFCFLVCSYQKIEETKETDNEPVISYEDTTCSTSMTNTDETNAEISTKEYETTISKDEQKSTTIESTETTNDSSHLKESVTNETTNIVGITSQEDLLNKGDVDEVNPSENTYFFKKVSKKLSAYFDIIVDLTTAIIVSFFGVIVTVFVFLKSALDRIIDENHYISDIANIYKESTAKILFYVCVIESLTLFLTLMWHAYLSFVVNYNQKFISYGLVALTFSLLFSLVISGWFCKRCIGIETYLRRIIMSECEILKNKLEEFMGKVGQDKDIYDLIGDWYEWDDKYEHGEDYVKEGRNLCNTMTVDQYINLFFRAELVLLSGEQGYDKREEHNSDIITIIQERINILKPNLDVVKGDLEKRKYFSSKPDNVHEEITKFEQNIKYDRESSEDYFTNARELYDYLRKYRNYLISWHHTDKKIKSKRNQTTLEETPKSPVFINKFSQALYYFVLCLLGTFVCATHISDLSFNGFSLNFANFYNSTLERLTLYSSEFYRTIFARAQIVQSEMDISRFYDVDFYGTTLVDSSLNNSKFDFVKYDGTRMVNTDLSSSDFKNCVFINSDFENCLFNNTSFNKCVIEFSHFSKTYFKDITCDCFTAKGCDFQYSVIQNWKSQTGDNDNLIVIKNGNFSNSTWRKMTVIDGDLSGSVFTKAEFIDVSFDGTQMSSILFLDSNLTSIRIANCNMKYGSLERAVLVAARLYKVKMNMGNLGAALAVNAQFRKCSFVDSNCAEADFSRAYFYSCDFQGARLYDCSMMKTRLRKCICKYLLADHLQFTFARCFKTNFQNSSLAESNFTETIFNKCNFDKSDMKAANASGTQFNNCSLNQVDFSNTRFIKTIFSSEKDILIIKNSNFSNCTFEEVYFENVFFESCIFENSTFINCEYKSKQSKNKKLKKASFKYIAKTNKKNITWVN